MRLRRLAVVAYRYCFSQTYLAISAELERRKKKKKPHRSCFTAECCNEVTPRNVAWEFSTIRCKNMVGTDD